MINRKIMKGLDSLFKKMKIFQENGDFSRKFRPNCLRTIYFTLSFLLTVEGYLAYQM